MGAIRRAALDNVTSSKIVEGGEPGPRNMEMDISIASAVEAESILSTVLQVI
jgi:hypothetical protein